MHWENLANNKFRIQSNKEKKINLKNKYQPLNCNKEYRQDMKKIVPSLIRAVNLIKP